MATKAEKEAAEAKRQAREARAKLLKEFGIKSTNGRTGRTFGSNETGKQHIATISGKVGTKKNVRIVPSLDKSKEKGGKAFVPGKGPDGFSDVVVPLTIAQVKRFGMEWANKNGRTAVDNAGCVLVK